MTVKYSNCIFYGVASLGQCLLQGGEIWSCRRMLHPGNGGRYHQCSPSSQPGDGLPETWEVLNPSKPPVVVQGVRNGLNTLFCRAFTTVFAEKYTLEDRFLRMILKSRSLFLILFSAAMVWLKVIILSSLDSLSPDLMSSWPSLFSGMGKLKRTVVKP